MYIKITNPDVIESFAATLGLRSVTATRLLVLVRKVKDRSAKYLTTNRDILWALKEAVDENDQKSLVFNRMNADLSENAGSTKKYVEIDPDSCSEVQDGIVDLLPE